MIKHQFHAPASGRDENLAFKDRVTKLELTLYPLFVLSKGNAFNHNYITDNFGFVSH
ncbi:hypothetical protein GCM10011496_33980 [Polaromonas eurypsychrophila]|uniref:Uncharacterized protein n=1 Tax=Polaromonas eurypsychrophila TaxID=1614635 RepID=A0A916SRP4_9BURK|nr:hypothetical protein GCM10011496_33980 [Polaromonas eurypsychrophila]